MNIELLADRSELIPQLAQLHFQEWGPLRPGETLERRMLRLRGTCGRAGIPMAVVATDGPTLCGSAILIGADMDTRPELSPWLAGVFVVPEFRRRGIGTSLVEHITNRAGALGVPTLYLYTPSAETLYSRRVGSH